MPYVTVGFMIWYFISACVLEGTETFIANEGLIRFLPAPLMIYVFRTVWRQILFFAHNVVVYVIVLAIFFRQLDQPYTMVNNNPSAIVHPGLSWWALMAIPAFVLIVVNGAVGDPAVRDHLRALPGHPAGGRQLHAAVLHHDADHLDDRPADRRRARQSEGDHRVPAKLNPFYHFIEIFRAPLVGQVQSWTHWAVAGGITVIGWSLALIALRNYRSRVAYWV